MWNVPIRMKNAVRAVGLTALVLASALAGCSPPAGQQASGGAATAQTAAANRQVAQSLPLADPQDFEDARRGFIARDPELRITGSDGHDIWNMAAYDFIQGDAPPTVNPSLWRQAKLNDQYGLFEVVPGIHQLRGYDMSDMTLIDGRTGWILVDPLISRQTAAAALALARKYLGDKPVSAIIFTHSHVDHFGGIDGVLPADPVTAAKIPIVAPAGFMEAATNENMLAGIAMGRRAAFMYGTALPRSPTGHVDTGLGKGASLGNISIRQPTLTVDHTPQELELDGVRFVFQYAPGSEAPAELTFYLPDFKAWCAAEIVTHNLHNLYTLRGAKVRDALKWSGYIDDALRRFTDVQVVFQSHHWPIWGHERVVDFLESQRDVYLYIHDQTLRLANDGLTPREIAEQITLPSTLRNRFANRSYYGTVRHDSKAVYQAYFGWYDGNPANLDPLPPEDAGRKYVAAMGGATAVLKQGKSAYEAGEYRWAAMLLNHLVFAEPSNRQARELLASVYDQLGYQAESGPWRDEYLSGAYELRRGTQGMATNPGNFLGLLRQTSPDKTLEAMAVRLNGPDADGKHLVFNFIFDDVNESYVLELKNAVLHHHRGDPVPGADATVHVTRDFMARLGTGSVGVKDLVMSDDLKVEGSRLKLLEFLSLLDRPDGRFAIVTP